MSKKITVRELTEIAESLRYLAGAKDVLEAEYRKGRSVRKLSRIRFSTNSAGRPTKRIIECLDEGETKYYDKKIELEITALIVKGHREEIP